MNQVDAVSPDAFGDHHPDGQATNALVVLEQNPIPVLNLEGGGRLGIEPRFVLRHEGVERFVVLRPSEGMNRRAAVDQPQEALWRIFHLRVAGHRVGAQILQLLREQLDLSARGAKERLVVGSSIFKVWASGEGNRAPGTEFTEVDA